MKKPNFFLIFAFAGLLKTNAESKIYVGIDAQLQMLNIKTKKAVISSNDGSMTNIQPSYIYQKDTVMPNVFLGVDFAEKFKFEVGYSKRIASNHNKEVKNITTSDQPVSVKSSIKTEVISFDFKPYKKFDNFSAYGILGVSHYKISIKEKWYAEGTYNGLLIDSDSQTRSKVSPTIGFGAEYFLSSSFFARAQAKYNYLNIKTPKLTYGAEKIRSAINLNLGIGYYF